MEQSLTTASVEPVLEPGLPIVDAHHHLWLVSDAWLAATATRHTISAQFLLPILRRTRRYLADEYVSDLSDGHNIVASVLVESGAMYRQGGPEALRSVGEVEFANGIGAMGEAGAFGERNICAAIVGCVALGLGSRAEAVLDAHMEAGGIRYRGVRSPLVYDPDPTIIGATAPGMLTDEQFRAGFALLAPRDLSFDAWIFEPQLPELTGLAEAFPGTRIVLNHLGGPIGVGRYAGQRAERFECWRESMRRLASCSNVAVKLGGVGLPFAGFASLLTGPQTSSETIAAEWRPYVETTIELFGATRCMFESNFPVDSGIGSYRLVWNAFKRLASGASADEKAALFSKTAADFYRISI